VNTNAAWSYAHTADARKLRDRSTRDGQSALAAAPSLKLIVVLLLSFGLCFSTEAGPPINWLKVLSCFTDSPQGRVPIGADWDPTVP